MAKAELTAEQRDHLEQHVAGVGHNQGPALLEHSEKIIEHAARHPRLKAELTGIRVMLDMLRSEIAGEYELPATTTGYVSAGLLLVAAITGVGIVTQPFLHFFSTLRSSPVSSPRYAVKSKNMSIGAQRATRPIYRSSRNYTGFGIRNLTCCPQTRGDPCRRPRLSGGNLIGKAPSPKSSSQRTPRFVVAPAVLNPCGVRFDHKAGPNASCLDWPPWPEARWSGGSDRRRGLRVFEDLINVARAPAD